MLVNINYRPGDIVRYKRKMKKETTVTCGSCCGTGMAYWKDNIVRTCPACEGFGYTIKEEDELQIQESAIRDIQLDFSDDYRASVFYKMTNWGSPWIPQEDVLEKIGRTNAPVIEF